MHGTFKVRTADPFSPSSIVAWLEKQPADAAYDYCNPFNCLLCQYFRACGLKCNSVTFNHRFPTLTSGGFVFPMFLKMISQGADYQECWTFGQALERARAYL